MTQPASPKRPPLYPTRSGAGALLGQQLAAHGYIGCILLGITPEGVEIAAIASIVAGHVAYPWRVLAAAKAAEQLGAKQVVIATPVASQAAAERIAARGHEFSCPTVVVDAGGHPAPYGDMSGETPERLRS